MNYYRNIKKYGKKNNKSNFSILLLVKNWKLTFIGAILFGLLAGGLGAALLALINKYGTGNLTNKIFLLSPIFIFLILLVFRFFSGLISKLILIKLSQGIIYELRILLTQKIINSSLKQFEKIGIPKIFATLTDDIFNISMLFSNIPVMCINIAVIVACLIYMSLLNLTLFLLSIIFIIFGVGSYRIITKFGIRQFERARFEENILFEHFKTLTEGFKELKINAIKTHEFFEEHLTSTASQNRYYNRTAFNIYALADAWGDLLFFIPVGVTLFYLANVLNLTNEQTIGYVMIVIFLIGPLSSLVALLPLIGKANVAVKNITSLNIQLNEEKKGFLNNYPNITIISNHSLKRLEISNLGFTYNSDEGNSFSIGPIDFSLQMSETIFIIGGNGSGKSTFAKLLTGLYTRQYGDIYLNKIYVDEAKLDWYRQHFSVVFSDFYLSKHLLGINNEYIEKNGKKLLEKFRLEQKVSIKDNQFSTIELSGGQRKRLALINAILEDKPIYVLDEWAADQSPMFKKIFYNEIIPWLAGKGKAVVVITHDDQYFNCADRIIKFDFGKIQFNKRIKEKNTLSL